MAVIILRLPHDRSPGLYKGDASFVHYIMTGDYLRFAQRLAQKTTCFMNTKVNPVKAPDFAKFELQEIESKDAKLFYNDMEEQFSVPVQKYEEFLQRVKKAVAFELNITWEKRYRAMMVILYPPKDKAETSPYSKTLQYRDFMLNMAYCLCWKMVEADKQDLARALDLEIEEEIDSKDRGTIYNFLET